MDFKSLYRQLEEKHYYVFSYEDILCFYPEEKRSNLKRMLHRWKKKGWIYALKRGLYELTYPKDFIIPDMHIANRLYNPSYISLETALSYYSIIPEISMAVTSITTKPTRRFKNKHGLFIYRTVKSDAFSGYYIEKQDNFDIIIAEPEKALVDFLYFRTYKNRKVNIRGERLDKKVILQLNRKKLYSYAKSYGIELKKVLYAYL
jgi:predicted transcriptional regulator of viral defense system